MEPVQQAASQFPRVWRALAIAATLAVLVMCFLPGDATPHPPVANFDKAIHAIAFGAVAYAWRRAGLSVVQTFLVGLGLAVVTEGGQALLASGRSGDLMDFAMDMGGVIVGLVVARMGFDG